LYRIAQESINNAVKHGAASKIVMEVTHVDDLLCLRIIDNGKGFRGAPRRTGLGIQIMQSRAAAIGARLEIISRRNVGTTVVCQAPLYVPDWKRAG
jgi:signal transduction histidine kinase